MNQTNESQSENTQKGNKALFYETLNRAIDAQCNGPDVIFICPGFLPPDMLNPCNLLKCNQKPSCAATDMTPILKEVSPSGEQPNQARPIINRAQTGKV